MKTCKWLIDQSWLLRIRNSLYAITELLTELNMTVACVTVLISRGWEVVVFTMAECQASHCAELLSAPDAIPLAREATQSQSTDSSISHFIIGLLSHSKSHYCFGSVLWWCSFFPCKLVWSAILSSGLWRASYRSRGLELSFRAEMKTLRISVPAQMSYHRLNI